MVAVSAKSNRSKADKGVVEWLPLAEAYCCIYLTDWVIGEDALGPDGGPGGGRRAAPARHRLPQ
ncbi:hypothetical protein GCM10009759_69250 [Kitasatospora saccharophila]|uniref:Uncharacterized protein n=1 Tax=Kitasatospora saccharophila TaxID=407973 RepID=A0ABN2Y2B0_9ACTN